MTPARSIAPDRLERVAGMGAVILLAFVLAALARGYRHWGFVPPVVWLHIVALVVVLALTPVLLWQRRGTARHRLLGWTWAICMVGGAFDSLFVQVVRPGRFSPIHLLSLVVLVMVPLAVIAARRHNIDHHRRRVRGLVIGALLIAGFFTFPFGRMLGSWLFG